MGFFPEFPSVFVSLRHASFRNTVSNLWIMWYVGFWGEETDCSVLLLSLVVELVGNHRGWELHATNGKGFLVFREKNWIERN